MFSPDPIVYLLDDEAGFIKALGRLLKAEGFTVQGFTSVDELLKAVEPDRIACLILDVAIPGVNGLELQSQFVKEGRELPIIFLTARGDIPTTVQAIKAGAVDFLTKPVQDSDLLHAVREALARATEHHAKHVELMALRDRYNHLTPREREVMHHVVAGRMNKQIASDLGTGEQNIKVHRGRVMEKMDVESLADLVRAAERLKAELGLDGR